MLELENISAGYKNKRVLEGVSLTFPKGKLTTVIGANGSGKSTLLKAIVGIIPRESGRILADGSDLSALSRQETARRIAYLPQGRSVPDMTVGQLVLHGRFPHLSYPRRYREADRRIADEAMERMGMLGYADRPLASLSGGMRQNAYIAMALAQDAEYILLDEPTTYLDISHQLGLMRTLRGLADGGKGVIAVLHDLPLAFSYSDLTAVIDGGRAVMSGSPLEVCRSGIISRVFGAELVCDEERRQFGYAYPPA